MIKTFESFNKITGYKFTDEQVSEMLTNIQLIYNYSYPITEMESIVNKSYLLSQFIDRDQLFDIPENFDTDSLSDEDRNEIATLYNRIYTKYELGNMADIDDIHSILLPIIDLTEVEFTIRLDTKVILFEIDVMPGVKTIPNPKRIEFGIDEYDNIVSEIKPAVKRIQDLGYKVVTFVGEKSCRIMIEVSRVINK